MDAHYKKFCFGDKKFSLKVKNVQIPTFSKLTNFVNE